MNNKLSQDQKSVLKDLDSWLAQLRQNHITVGGYAGTGKTTLIAILRLVIKNKNPKKRIAFATLTGKASLVLKTKLHTSGALFPKDFVGTIHSLMYTPKIDSQGKVISWKKSNTIPYDLIILDEASMVTKDIWQDLLKFNIPIIAFGDHGQLPPIGDNFNLMDDPNLTLERIHRQAADSPIIQLATIARTTGNIPLKHYSPTAKKIPKDSELAGQIIDQYFSVSHSNQDVLVLCGRNQTRIKLNQKLRYLKGFEQPEPSKGETLICLRNNYNAAGGPIFNGMTGTLQQIKPKDQHWYDAHISLHDSGHTYQGIISRHQFNHQTYLDSVDGIDYKNIGDRFDFGYALTVHKAQGSQANTVIIFEEKSQYWDDLAWRRWLYTAVTRAQQNLYILA